MYYYLFHGTIREGSQFNFNSNQIQKYLKRFELTCPLQGTIAASKGATKCDSCDRGLYRPSTSDEPVCAACSPGTFAEYKGSGKSLVSVHILYRSHFEFLRYWHLHMYNNIHIIIFSASCENCPVGTYSEMGAIECKLCVAGQYQDVVGQTICKKCAPGTFSENPGKLRLNS